jgi:hypothetical protein
MIDIHTKNNKLVLAHRNISTTRWIRPFRKFESFQNVLTRFVKMLEKNSQAIITLHLESHTNNISARTIPGILETSGAVHYLYTDADDWKTIGEMIESDKRLVVFSNRRRDKPFIHSSATMETNYDLSKSNRNNLRRDRSMNAPIFIMNHFYSFTWFKRYSRINSRENLDDRVNEITKKYHKRPNFIALDYVHKGDGLEIVRKANER